MVNKRRERFLIATPVCFLIADTCGIYLDLIILINGFDLGSELPLYLINVGAFAHMFNLMGHWFFATQYLQTCLILPRLLIESKLEWVLEDSENKAKQSTTTRSMDKNRLIDALNNANVDMSNVGDSLVETISKIDEVI